MKTYKDKQFLVFELDNGKTVKYDLANKQCIGVKGKPVKSLQSHFANISFNYIIDSCEDKKYAEFLRYVQRASYYSISNIGTVLERLAYYSKYEQFFAAGLGNLVQSHWLNYKLNEIPKALLKICNENEFVLSDTLITQYKRNPDAYQLAFNLQYETLTPSMIKNIVMEPAYGNYQGRTAFNVLLEEYGYRAKRLMQYLDYLATHEAVHVQGSFIRQLVDHARMMNTLSGKFDRYPKYFLTTHAICSRNYNRFVRDFPEEIFRTRYRKDYEMQIDDYIFIYPKTTQDIKDEAVQQSNCVASYIDRVINGNCHILFLRKIDKPNNSLVTIEVVDDKIVQARRRFNYSISLEEREIINKWNKIIEEQTKKTKEKIA